VNRNVLSRVQNVVRDDAYVTTVSRGAGTYWAARAVAVPTMRFVGQTTHFADISQLHI